MFVNNLILLHCYLVVGHISMEKILIKVDKCPPREILAALFPHLAKKFMQMESSGGGGWRSLHSDGGWGMRKVYASIF